MSTEHLGADYPFVALNETAKDTIEGAVTSGISEMGELPTTPAVLEAQHLRKYFPLRSLKLFGPKKVVHAVDGLLNCCVLLVLPLTAFAAIHTN